MKLLDTEALAARWDVPVQTVYGLRYRGDAPPAIRVGRELRWKLEDVEAWEDARRDDGSTRPEMKVARASGNSSRA